MRLNPELSESDLKIEFPPGSTVVDKLAGNSYEVGPGSQRRLISVSDAVEVRWRRTKRSRNRKYRMRGLRDPIACCRKRGRERAGREPV